MELTLFDVCAGIMATYGLFFIFIFIMWEYGWIFGTKKERLEHKIKSLLEERDNIYWFKKFKCNPAFVNKDLLEINIKEYETRIKQNFEDVDKLKIELNEIIKKENN